MNDWVKLAGIVGSGLVLAYIRWTDPNRIRENKKKKIAALKKKAKKLENLRDRLLAEHSSDGHTVQLGRIINSLAKLRKEIRALEAN